MLHSIEIIKKRIYERRKCAAWCEIRFICRFYRLNKNIEYEKCSTIALHYVNKFRWYTFNVCMSIIQKKNTRVLSIPTIWHWQWFYYSHNQIVHVYVLSQMSTRSHTLIEEMDHRCIIYFKRPCRWMINVWEIFFFIILNRWMIELWIEFSLVFMFNYLWMIVIRKRNTNYLEAIRAIWSDPESQYWWYRLIESSCHYWVIRRD
jgi:hypothetical protein